MSSIILSFLHHRCLAFTKQLEAVHLGSPQLDELDACRLLLPDQNFSKYWLASIWSVADIVEHPFKTLTPWWCEPHEDASNERPESMC